jgi:hypothetical protein
MDSNTKAMFDILTKLDGVDKTTRIVAERAERDIDLKMAINQRVDETSVSVQNYRVDIVLQNFAGRQKKFYNVVEGNRILHKELALFETAMGVVKNLMLNKSSKVQDLVRYDTEYTNSLYEVYMHNSRIKKGSINEDVALAKLDRAKDKLQEAKNKILRKL